MECAGLQLRLTHRDAYKRLFPQLVANGVGFGVGLEIATRHRVTVRNNDSIVDIVGVHRVVMNAAVSHRVVVVVHAVVAQHATVEHRVDVGEGVVNLLVVGSA